MEDAAAEVRALQRKGLRVSAVFMGEDASAAAASRIYGKNMARIRGMDQLARAAGQLIQRPRIFVVAHNHLVLHCRRIKKFFGLFANL